MSGGLLIIGVGVVIVAQVVLGNALGRLGIAGDADIRSNDSAQGKSGQGGQSGQGGGGGGGGSW